MASPLPQSLALPRESLRPPSADRQSVGLLVSLLAHGLLIAGLALGVQWHTQDPEGVEAELWAATPQIAAPAAVEPPPEPAQETTQPPPKAATPPPPDTAAQDQRDAEIAIEQDRKRKAQKEAERLEAERDAQARKEAEDQRARDKRQQAERKDKEDKAKAEREAKAEQDEADRKAAEKKTKLDQAKKDKAEADRREAQRQDNIRRMNAQLGGTGAENSTGTAARSAGPSANYAGRIKAYIKPNIVLTDPVPGNPTAEVEVRVAPDGSIIGRKLSKSSGSAAWDEAVIRAIDRTAKLPRDTDGTVPSAMTISFKPSE
ncbi:cell envelope integrity protein TolA [Ideonella azotifigens]|uniref:Cell envelope integrity protein TolA n=1 Tax=Ideonella azotifigens TaxID=513160 RepID=A0ABN1K6P8_9BURK|nr:cell envelope integrity protein TolA [Ideonella azotifigens]MCD2342130.1 cell envelope integrity protein TolA [Ideonella azotifigens]